MTYRILNATDREGLLKVGYTTRDVRKRVREQLQTSGLKYKIVLEESALRGDGMSFTNHDIHKALQQAGITRVGGEWFACTQEKVRAAVEKTANYFKTMLK